MTLKIESKHFLLMGKVVSTILLLFVIFCWIVFLFLILPIILYTVFHGKKKNISSFSLAMAMSPVVIIAALIWRTWKLPSSRFFSSYHLTRGRS